VLSEDATVLGRGALPRPGWGRQVPRARRAPRPLSQSQSQREASRKRQAWGPERSWSRLTSGGWRSVIGAVPSGTARVIATIGPPWDTEGWRQDLHPGMALLRHTGQAGGMVADRRGSHRAHKRASTLTHGHEQWRWPLWPAHCGHPLNPLAGCWRVRKDRSGAGRCVPALPQLYHRTRRVLMAHHERPI
jgi:hypothetical protein